VAALTGRALETEAAATGDYAVLELYTRLAAQGRQLLGPYSRFGFHHPGPAYFYANVPLYVLSGERFAGILMTAALINVVSAALLLRRIGRYGGTAALITAGLIVALFLSWRGPGWIFSAWNPSVAVLPFGLALVSFAAFAAGEARALPTAVLAGSFTAQTHLGVLPAVMAIGLTAAFLLIPPVRETAGLPPRGRMERGPLVAAVLLAAVVWAPPVIEQLSPQGGNLAHILGFSALSDERHTVAEALATVGTATAGWLFSLRGTAAAWLLVLAAVLLMVGHGAARRTRQPFAAALSLITLAGYAAAVLSVARVTGPLLPYLFRWMAMLPVGVAAAVAAGVAPLLRARMEASRRPLLLLSVGLVALAVVSGRNLALAQSLLQSAPTPTEASEAAARLAEAIDAGVSTTSHRALVEVAPHTDRDLVLGVVLAMDKAGTRFAVRPFGPFRLGGRWTPDGTEDARLVLGPEGAEVARLPGVRLLGRDAGLFAYLVPMAPAAGRP
jgi:hypothetical protein